MKDYKNTWLLLAELNQLTVVSHNPLQLSGQYRGYQLTLKPLEQFDRMYTQIKLDLNLGLNERDVINQTYPFKQALTVEVIQELLTPDLAADWQISGDRQLKGDGQYIIYEQVGLEEDFTHLQQILEQLCDLAQTYGTAIILGGEAIPALRDIAATNKKLRATAVQLILGISQDTTAWLGPQTLPFICSDCLAYAKECYIDLLRWKNIAYFGCPRCGQSRNMLEVRVVLDSTMPEDRSQKDRILRINWLAQRELFDFNSVEIRQASDEDVERFAVQVGNDMHPLRRPRYKKMPCFIDPACNLSQNSSRVLNGIFGQVTEINQKEQ